MLKELRNYILEKNFKINYINEKLNIVNYECIDHFDVDKIIIRYQKGIIVVKGESLIITKLLSDEMLITGKIKNIEFK